MLAKYALAAVLVCACSHALAEELTPQKRADIEKLLQATGASQLGKQMATIISAQLAQGLKKARPDIPQHVLESLPNTVGTVFEANGDALRELIVPLYHKYFTAAEIKELVRFYSTTLGKKTVGVMPQLMQESIVVGQQWGQTLGPAINQQIRAQLEKEGIRL
jgi:uncharacterized protein